MENNFQPLIIKLKNLGDEISKKEVIVISENEKDIKLSTDLDINQKLTSFLKEKYPYDFLSEESKNSLSFTKNSDCFWIIDPLDGSMNFSRNIPISCISVALWNDNFIRCQPEAKEKINKLFHSGIFNNNGREMSNNIESCLVKKDCINEPFRIVCLDNFKSHYIKTSNLCSLLL